MLRVSVEVYNQAELLEIKDWELDSEMITAMFAADTLRVPLSQENEVITTKITDSTFILPSFLIVKAKKI